MPLSSILVLLCLFLVSSCVIASSSDPKISLKNNNNNKIESLRASKVITKQDHYHPVLKNHAGIEYHAATVEKLDRTNLLHRVVNKCC